MLVPVSNPPTFTFFSSSKMKGVFALVFALPLVSSLALNASTTAVLGYSVVQGGNFGTVTKFLGIPYATAARFSLPQPIPAYFKPLNATAYGPSCPTQLISSSGLARRSSELQERATLKYLATRDNAPSSEDCLSVNIIRPAGARSSDKLPVVIWIYGGGFEAGDTTSYDDLGTSVVTRSAQLGKSIIFVSMNYRVSAFGFLASAEVQKEKLGNFGLYDQRLAMQWTKKYIRSFGGDPSKITIWGQSAGAISASFHMLAFGGKTDNLFRGAFMQSGAPVSVGPLTNGQKYYDFLVAETNCTKAASTLACLRTAPFDVLSNAINNTPNYMSYQGLSLAWTPHVDGVFLQQTPFSQIKAGKVAKIPIVSGNVDDEGTVFSLAQTNVTTDADFVDFVKTVYAPTATDAQIAQMVADYPSNPADGSPFDTGSNNTVYPQYKRIAAFQGDIAFQGPKRYFLQSISGKQKVWSYLSKVLKNASVLGSYHSSDIATGILVDPLINFVVSLDPNDPSTPTAWPQYTKALPNLYTFTDTAPPTITNDTYRAVPLSDLVNISGLYPV